MTAFGSYLKKIREAKNMTLNQVAMYADISAAQLSRIETGKRGTPKPQTIEKIASALKMDYNDLMQAAGYLEKNKIDNYDIINITNSPDFLLPEGTYFTSTFEGMKYLEEPCTIGELIEKYPDIFHITERTFIGYKISSKTLIYFTQAGTKGGIDRVIETVKKDKNDEKDIAKRLKEFESEIENSDGLAFDGEPMSDEAKESLLESMELLYRQTQRINKKYTPKKYREDEE